MSIPLLVEAYRKLPQPKPGDDPDLLFAGQQSALDAFLDEVREKYQEGTLQRLLQSGDAPARRAAALALGTIGGLGSNALLAQALHDADNEVRRIAVGSLWEIWFHAGDPHENEQLQRYMRMADSRKAGGILDRLIAAAPRFAEPVNQRAVMRFLRGEYAASAADCEAALKLNPYHFGAASGLGYCQLRLKRPRAAVRAFRRALEIHPNLDEVKNTLAGLEAALGDGGAKE